MPMIARAILLVLAAPAFAAGPVDLPAQIAAATQVAAPPPPPATKLEGLSRRRCSRHDGFNQLGNIRSVSIDAREIRDSRGGGVRGLVVEVTEDQYREQRSFVDADEIPELLRGMGALLGVKTNPTTFNSFEVGYSTRGAVRVTAFNASSGKIQYQIQAGRVIRAGRFIDDDELRQFRGFIEAAQEKLNSPGGR